MSLAEALFSPSMPDAPLRRSGQAVPIAALQELLRVLPWLRAAVITGYVLVAVLTMATIPWLLILTTEQSTFAILSVGAMVALWATVFVGVRRLGAYLTAIRLVSESRDLGDFVDALTAQVDFWRYATLATLVGTGVGTALMFVLPEVA